MAMNVVVITQSTNNVQLTGEQMNTIYKPRLYSWKTENKPNKFRESFKKKRVRTLDVWAKLVKESGDV